MPPLKQKSFTLVENAPSAFGIPAGAGVSRPASKPPMTTKQARKLYNESTRGPRRSKAEQRAWERAEQERIRRELQQESAANRARLLRERKKARDEDVLKDKKKKGLPLVQINPSQDTISRFVKGFGGAKRANPEEEDKENQTPDSRKRRRLGVVLEDDRKEGGGELFEALQRPLPKSPTPRARPQLSMTTSDPKIVAHAADQRDTPMLGRPTARREPSPSSAATTKPKSHRRPTALPTSVLPDGGHVQGMAARPGSEEMSEAAIQKRLRPPPSKISDPGTDAVPSQSLRKAAGSQDKVRQRQTPNSSAGSVGQKNHTAGPKTSLGPDLVSKKGAPPARVPVHPSPTALEGVGSVLPSSSPRAPQAASAAASALGLAAPIIPQAVNVPQISASARPCPPAGDPLCLHLALDSEADLGSRPDHVGRADASRNSYVAPDRHPQPQKSETNIAQRPATTMQRTPFSGMPKTVNKNLPVARPIPAATNPTTMPPPPRPAPEPRVMAPPPRRCPEIHKGTTSAVPAPFLNDQTCNSTVNSASFPPLAPPPAVSQAECLPPSSTQLFLFDHFCDFLPSPSQEAREILGSQPIRKPPVFTKPKPLRPTKANAVAPRRLEPAQRHNPPPINTMPKSPRARKNAQSISAGIPKRIPTIPPQHQPSAAAEVDISFLCTQDLMISSQDMREVEEPSVAIPLRTNRGAKATSVAPHFLKRAPAHLPPSTVENSLLPSDLAPLGRKQPQLAQHQNSSQRKPTSNAGFVSGAVAPPTRRYIAQHQTRHGQTQTPDPEQCPPNRKHQIAPPRQSSALRTDMGGQKNASRSQKTLQPAEPRTYHYPDKKQTTEVGFVEDSFDTHDIDPSSGFGRAPPPASRREKETPALARPRIASPLNAAIMPTAAPNPQFPQRGSAAQPVQSSSSASRPLPNPVECRTPMRQPHEGVENLLTPPAPQTGGSVNSEAPDSEGRPRFFTASGTNVRIGLARIESMRTFAKEEEMRRRAEERMKLALQEEERRQTATEEARAKTDAAAAAEAEAPRNELSQLAAFSLEPDDDDSHAQGRVPSEDDIFDMDEDADFDSLMLEADLPPPVRVPASPPRGHCTRSATATAARTVALTLGTRFSPRPASQATAEQRTKGLHCSQETDYGDLDADIGESLAMLGAF